MGTHYIHLQPITAVSQGRAASEVPFSSALIIRKEVSFTITHSLFIDFSSASDPSEHPSAAYTGSSLQRQHQTQIKPHETDSKQPIYITPWPRT